MAIVTVDQPLYAKADDIVLASPELNRLVVRLGGFHTAMSFMGAIGFIMRGSGIEELWSTVYAPHSVEHMLTWHAYSRALRTHLIAVAALTSLISDNHSDPGKGDLHDLFKIHSDLLSGRAEISELLPAYNVVRILQKESESFLENGLSNIRTGRLWVNYMTMVSPLRLFIFAERTGDWALHLHMLAKMIPAFHAAGHIQYAKFARRYLDS